MAACLRCGYGLPAEARYCPSCGDPVGADPASLTLEQVEPRLFGVVPPLTTLGLGLATLAAGVAALATQHWVLGSLVSLVALAFLVLGLEAIRHARPSGVASGLVARLRDWTGFAAGSAGAWSRAGRELVAARRELAALAAERERTQLELGAAAFRQDNGEVARLRARMRELDERARERAGLTHRAVDEARRRVHDERLAIQPTEVVEIDSDRVS
jgi:hypothetical protein